MSPADTGPRAAPRTMGDGAPVTVAVTRRAVAGRVAEMDAWVSAGQRLAAGFDGFLGAGHVRPHPGSEQWHMLYRFADTASVERWERSPERRWWLDSSLGLVEETRVERRTGIEGWFDEPREVEVRTPPAPAPPRWKQACVIWLGFFPTSLAAQAAVGPFLGGVPLVARVLVLTLLLTPLMTYLVLPFVTRRLAWWLEGRPFPYSRRRRGQRVGTRQGEASRGQSQGSRSQASRSQASRSQAGRGRGSQSKESQSQASGGQASQSEGSRSQGAPENDSASPGEPPGEQRV